MQTVEIRAALAAVTLMSWGTTAVRAEMPAGPVNIPLQLLRVAATPGFPDQYRLAINVGINGGAARSYLFDTGSALFNAVYTQSFWPGITPSTDPTTGNTPNSTVTNGSGVTYCYGNGVNGCRGYEGNVVQVGKLDFYTSPTTTTPSASLSASPGYQINAVYNQWDANVATLIAGATTPVQENLFYGVFGAGEFTTQRTATGYTAGGVLGQTIVRNALQGYVVAANGQRNPVSSSGNEPTQSNGQNVYVAGNPDRQAVTPCSPCVTLGLTPEMLGQFALINPGTAVAPSSAGLVPWANAGPGTFPNPYGNGTGNNAGAEFGVKFNVTLSAAGYPSVSSMASALLDTGTGGLTLSQVFANQPGISSATNVSGGVTLTASGLTPEGLPIAGLPSSTSVLQGNGTVPITYTATFDQGQPGTTNTLGLSFFLQNSVLFDLSNQAVGYTPYFVTDANIATTTGGELIVDGTNVPLGLAGTISGPGGVWIQNGGSVQLSAANTYTGPTAIDLGGKLQIAGIGSIASSSGLNNDGILDISRAWRPVALRNLNGSGQINLGAQTLVVTNADGTFSGVIADGGSSGQTGGSLILSGGALALAGANTYTGGTLVTGGATLGISSDSNLGDISGVLMLHNGRLYAQANITSDRAVVLGPGGGTFDIDGFTLALNTPVKGPGSLTKSGDGLMSLGGENTYTGGTIVTEGTLQLAPGASLSAQGALIVTGGTFDLNGNDARIGALAGTGGTISLGSSRLTVAGDASTVLATTLTGSGGLTMAGNGLLNLVGANTYTGPTLVTKGGLAVNGSITSDVTVGPGGTLGGNGLIIGTVTMRGTAAPGNSIGTLNVSGSYTQAAGSTYLVEANASGQADRINVSGPVGTAAINGGVVTVAPSAGVYAPSTTYTILSATGGVSGRYAGSSTLLPFLQSSLAYDTSNVYLTLAPGGFARGGQTSNQIAVGGVIDRSVAGATGDFATVVGTMAGYTLPQGQAALTALSGENYSGFGSANLGSGLLFMNTLGQQMSLVRGGPGTGKDSRTALAAACDIACDGEPASKWSLWASAVGGTATIAGTAGSASLTYNAGGVATGLDYRFDPRFLAGLAIGFSSGSQWSSGFSGQGTTNAYQASLYASFTPGASYVDAMAGYGYNDNQMTRQIVLPNLASRVAQGRTGANQFLGQVEAGYRIGVYAPAAASVTPFARFEGTTVNQWAFTESGAGALNLSVAQQTTGSARSVLGAEFAGAFGDEGREKLAMQLRLGWAHEFASTARPVTASFAGAPGSNFTVFGAAPQTDTAILSLAADTKIAAGVGLYLRYDGEVGYGISSHALSGGLRATW